MHPQRYRGSGASPRQMCCEAESLPGNPSHLQQGLVSSCVLPALGQVLRPVAAAAAPPSVRRCRPGHGESSGEGTAGGLQGAPSCGIWHLNITITSVL